MAERKCSYMIPAEVDSVSGVSIGGRPCENPAVWELWGASEMRASCTKHVGHLLTDGEETTVAPVRERGMAGDPGLPKMR